MDPATQLDRLRAALAASGDIAYEWDMTADEIVWLDGSASVASVAALSAVRTGEALHERIHPDDLVRRLEALSGLYAGKNAFECEFRLRQTDGEPRWYHDRGIARFGPDGRPIRLIGTMRPIDGHKANHARLEYLANYDDLTGHFNRTRLRDALEQAIYYNQRYGVVGAFLVVGIDKINMVNQAFGYDVADSVIVAVGQRLDRCLRACDVIGRLSGDRFGVVLSNCPATQLGLAAEKILEVARNTEVETAAGPIHVTVSIGAVVFPAAATTAVDAMTKADIALQNAKRLGRNTWASYAYSEEQRRDHRKNMVIAEQVKRALQEDRLTLAFQPIVCARTHEPAIYECLLRMISPTGEVVPAGVFMPVVEELGLIRLIDRHVFELAVDVLALHPEARLAINVSAMTANDRSWLRNVGATLRGKAEIANRLTIEITETAGLEDVEECARFVARLHELGCRVALDDFGAGYTSFRHLKMLAVDMVKIDGSFVRDLGQNRDNLIFVRSLLDLARNFSLDTVAECVETMEDAQLLAEEGVHFLQGYAFGRPMLEPPWEKAAVPYAVAVRLGVPAVASSVR